jgi:hypothetical protein
LQEALNEGGYDHIVSVLKGLKEQELAAIVNWSSEVGEEKDGLRLY